MKSIELPKTTGFAGFDGSGKDNTALALSEMTGVPVIGLGDILGDLAVEEGFDKDDRVAKRSISARLAAEYNDPAIMVKLALAEAAEGEGRRYKYANDNGELYITSIRRFAEAEEIKRLGGALIWIHTPIEERYRRVVARARGSGDAIKSFEEFVTKGDEEIYPEDRDNPNIVNVSRVFGASDYIYNNPTRTREEQLAHLAETFRIPRQLQ